MEATASRLAALAVNLVSYNSPPCSICSTPINILDSVSPLDKLKMPSPLLPLLLLSTLLLPTSAAFDENDLAGLYRLRFGTDNPRYTRCGDLLRFKTSGTKISAANITVDDNDCTGGTLLLQENPVSGRVGFVKFFAKTSGTGTFFAGVLNARVDCNNKLFATNGATLVFVRPNNDIVLTWDDVLGEDKPLEEASQSATFTFRRGIAYVTLNNRCLYVRDDSAPVRVDTSAVCLPAHASIQLESGRHVPVSEVRVGDKVHVGRGEFSPVFAWTHRDKAAVPARGYVAIDVGRANPLTTTHGHMVYANARAVPAGEVKVGDVMTDGDGREVVVRGVKVVSGMGLYNPQTLHGDIVVDGVIISTYTSKVERVSAHALLTPLRAAFRCGVRGVGDGVLAILERFLFMQKP